MKEPVYETIQYLNPLGISMQYITTPGGYHPMHWHEDLEILYPLNGTVTIWVDKKTYLLKERHFSVIESAQVHSTCSLADASMFLCIHLSKMQFKHYLPEIELRSINCIPDEVMDDHFPEYRNICELFEAMTRLYINELSFHSLEAEGILLQIIAQLLRSFSAEIPFASTVDTQSRERIREVISYVETNFRDPISLLDIAGHLGLTKEYFCRFFKKSMGISFLKYLNDVRLSHIYQDLQNTDAPIAEIMERNGFTNQKLFNQEFKKQYGQTPSAVRHPRNFAMEGEQ